MDSDFEKLQSETTNALRKAGSSPQLQREAILSYLRAGYGMGLSPGELIDSFCVSYPNIVEDAGFDEDNGDAVAALFDELHVQFRRDELKPESSPTSKRDRPILDYSSPSRRSGYRRAFALVAGVLAGMCGIVLLLWGAIAVVSALRYVPRPHLFPALLVFSIVILAGLACASAAVGWIGWALKRD